MGLEVVNLISDYNVLWPLGTDKRREGDDHIRNIKKGIKNTFPNINAALDVTDEQLNELAALPGPGINSILTELLNHIEAKGSIKMHDLANAAIPAGWHLCDGSVVAGYGTVPDMRDKFVVGGGSTYTNQSTGGTLNTSNGGTHTPTIQGHTLIAGEVPPLSVTLPVTLIGIGSASGGTSTGNVLVTGTTAPSTLPTTGGGGSHTHVADVVPAHQHTLLPPYYAAVFIVKTSAYTPPT